MTQVASLMLLLALMSGTSASEITSPGKPEAVYKNPIIDIIGLADPTVIRYKDTYYLYPTWDCKGYDVFTSPDLVHWTHRGKCFMAPQANAWAPDVFHHAQGDGKFYLYYTVDAPDLKNLDPFRAKQIGVAVADNPLGPFEDKGRLMERAIDAHMFQDSDGSLFLYYVNVAPLGNQIWVQPMTDPLRKKGNPKVLLGPTEPWETRRGQITEGPWLLKRGDTYYLMYSGSGADGPDYAIGYATSQSPLGPFRKYAGNPIARRGEGIFGPGHHCVIEGPRGNLWMVYHQKLNDAVDWARFLAIDPLWFDSEGVIHVKTTRETLQPAP